MKPAIIRASSTAGEAATISRSRLDANWHGG
jgi:hypothetical protein